MRSIRLLPVVIFAALALLVFKGIGIVTNGGYVLTGTVEAAAQASGGEMTLPSDTMAGDTSPTMSDQSPSIVLKSDLPAPVSAASRSAAATPLAVASNAIAAAAMASSSAPPASSAPASDGASASSASQTPTERQAAACPDNPPASGGSPTSGGAGDLTDKIGTALATACPETPIPVNSNGDALPTTKDGNGHIVPLQFVDGDNSEEQLLSRLGERSAQLDKRQADLDMREAIVAAAEKKLEDQTKALQDLQAQVNALVDQKQAAEDASFKAIVSMYEQMKAKDAAKIFDTLDIGVLIKIARAMNPRNMSPILAAMSSGPAQQLTTELASVTPQTTVPTGTIAAANLPQIVGH